MNQVLSSLAKLIGVHFVEENYVAPVFRLGMYNRVCGPGFFWVIPILESVGQPVKSGLRFTSLNVSGALSIDSIPIDIGLQIFFKFDPERTQRRIAAQLVRVPEHVLTDIAEDYAESFLRQVVANFTAEDIYTRKAVNRIQAQLSHILADKLEFLGYVINLDSGVLIKAITASSEFQQPMLDANRYEVTLRVLNAYQAADVDLALFDELVESLAKGDESMLLSLADTVTTKRRWRPQKPHRMSNPYKPGPPIREPHLFFGRQKALQTILDGLGEVHFAVHGPRRIGKTSLLRQLERRLQELTHSTYLFVPVFVQLQRVPEAELFQRLIRLVAEAARQHTGPLSLVADDKGTGYDDVDFTNDLETIAEAVRQRRGKEARIVLLLDEGEQLNEYSRDTQKRWRGVLMDAIGQEHLRLVWSGLGITPIQDDTSPWYNLFAPPIHLAPLDRETTVRLITEPVKGIYQYDEAAIALILEQSGGRPYEVQSLCHAVIEHVKHRIQGQKVSPPVRVTAEDVKAVVQKPSQVPAAEMQYETPSLSRQVAEGQSEYRTADGDDE